MGSFSNESIDEFLASIKQAGVAICNEAELRERLTEAQRWRYAFMTLAANGRSLGIRFESASSGTDEVQLRRVLSSYELPERCQTILSESLKTQH